MNNVFDVLKERGFIEQCTHEDEIRELLEKEQVTFYIGFDPTADSLHIGHFLQIMVMTHMQRHGHKPIALIGGGTTMVGDPTDKTDMRKMLTQEQINENGEKFKTVFKKFLDFSDDKAIMLNNADWLLDLNYVELLREVGVHFSVNRMLAADCYKTRMEQGLTFLEFNYMIMQSYDFYVLYRDYNCKMQLGGNDQWSNILGGTELVRRKLGGQAYGMTFSLLTTSDGKKMGKTEKGALWLDPEKTSPYDFYQYWRNVDDADVRKCLALLTFLPMEEVERLSSFEGSEINKSKEVLAYEVTKIIHGEDEANKAQNTAKSLFSLHTDSAEMPTTEIDRQELSEMEILDIMIKANLIPSKSEGRRLVTQGGVQVDGEKVEDLNYKLPQDKLGGESFIIKKGKKVHHKIKIT
ncbi:tyrosine--tRNA ligase [Alkalibacter saccharofermentans]|jgi:tyrosyl-tRNA synthetase|uniref:Tyrosine--tRNA ligase n=1 Tax=Alkalibacter saccharofermentans DSM 14828 TaxID=1120975 RepID=A0A1M4YNW9_9FIRM|nr:tyrosine--tRNA ligase [Alkalibacter saccharofermentans]SHF07431.1 tyrosyl-tRNA synthetase [Alkalibacter saccharofermentans DSM 14828]